MKIISSEKFPIGKKFSPVTQSGNMVYLSGQQGADPTTGEFAKDGIRGETEQTLKNIKELLALAGTDLEHVVKVNAYVSDLKEFDDFNEVYISFFPSSPPARTACEAKLAGGCRVEIDVIAEIPSR